MAIALHKSGPVPADQIFEKYASSTVNGTKVMTPNDFINAIAPPQLDYSKISRKSFAVLFPVADSNDKGYVTLDDWISFENLLNLPDADYEIAFRFFDKSGNGKVSPSEFKNQYSKNKTSEIPFDWDSSWAQLYLGTKGTRDSLTYSDFSQLLSGIVGERVRQGFLYYDKKRTGHIKIDEFKILIEETLSHKASKQVLENLNKLPNLLNSGNEISYSATRAFLNVLNHSDLVDFIANSAVKKTKDGLISKKLFNDEVSRSTRFAIFSPLEVDILFFFASLNSSSSSSKDGGVKFEDFKKVIDPSYREPSIRYALAEQHKIESAQNITKDPKTFLNQVFESAYNFGLGAVAGAFGATMVYPIDLVKTRMQNQRSSTPGQVMYKNSWDCFKKTVSREGFTGLYSGLGPQLVGVAPEKAIKLTVNDLIRGKAADSNGKIALPFEILAGGSAGGCQVVFTNPLEIVKIRLQIQGELLKADPTLPRRGAIWVVRSLGLMGLYKGASACLLRDVPFSAIYFPTYAHLKKDVFNEGPNKQLNVLELLTAGAIAGMPAAYLSTPADVIKTRLQVEARQGQTQYHGLRHCAKTILKEEGFKAFFKGGVARVLRSSPQFGFTLAAYEALHKLIPLPGHAKTEGGHLVPSIEDIDEEVKRAGKGIYESGHQGLKFLKSRNALRLLLDLDQGFGKVNTELLDKFQRK